MTQPSLSNGARRPWPLSRTGHKQPCPMASSLPGLGTAGHQASREVRRLPPWHAGQAGEVHDVILP